MFEFEPAEQYNYIAVSAITYAIIAAQHIPSLHIVRIPAKIFRNIEMMT